MSGKHLSTNVNETKPLFGDKAKHSIEWQIQEHDRVLDESKQVISRAMILASANAFCFASTTNVAVLYARQFDNDISLISWIIWFSSVSFSILSLITSTLAEFLGFDHLLTAVFLAAGIGVLLEACAQNIIMWGIGYILSKQPIFFIFIGYAATMLPLIDNKQYTGTFYQLFASFYLLGPIAAGLSVFFLDRVRFRVVCCLLLVARDSKNWSGISKKNCVC